MKIPRIAKTDAGIIADYRRITKTARKKAYAKGCRTWTCGSLCKDTLYFTLTDGAEHNTQAAHLETFFI